MLNNITLDQYLEIKEDIAKGIAIFNLEGSDLNLLTETSFYAVTPMEVYVIQMDKADFSMMDIGVYPKTFLIHKGKEVREFNGIPNEDVIGDIYGQFE